MSERTLFGRRWKLIAANDSEERTWESAERPADPELNIAFKIQKNADLKSNDADITLYNLSPDSMTLLEKHANIELHAGYADAQGLIYKGAVAFVSDQKQGPDWVTTVSCKDGALQWRETGLAITFKKDTPIQTIIKKLADRITDEPDLPNFKRINAILRGELRLELRKIYARATKTTAKPNHRRLTDAERAARKQARDQATAQRKAKATQARETFKLERARTIRDTAMKYLTDLCAAYGLKPILEDQSLTILPIDAAREDDIVYLTADSGLIGSPEPIESGGWRVTSLLRHEFKLFGQVAVRSANLDGVYRVRRIEHTGERRGNEWFTILEVEPFEPA